MARDYQERRMETPRPIEVGSRFAFVAQFLGRPLEYVYQDGSRL
jgi:hypothetical protein